MPKKIKKQKMSGAEKANRIIAIVSMVIAMAFAGVLIVLLKDVMNESNSWSSYAVFAGYALFFAATLTHCVQGIYVYEKQEHYGVLFQAIISGGAAVTALVNLQFAIVMLLSALGKETTAEKLIGDRTMSDFILAQSTAWTLIVIGIAAAIVLGIIAMVRLINERFK